MARLLDRLKHGDHSDKSMIMAHLKGLEAIISSADFAQCPIIEFLDVCMPFMDSNSDSEKLESIIVRRCIGMFLLRCYFPDSSSVDRQEPTLVCSIR